MIKKLLFCLIFSHVLVAQTDFQNLKWEFRGPTNIDFGYKNVVDITQDPTTETKVWACTISDGLLINDDITNPQSLWRKSNLPTSKAYKIRFHPANPKIVFVLTDYRMWKSTDGGNSWLEINKSLPESRYQDIWISRKGNVYFQTQNEINAILNDGSEFRLIYRSENGLKIKQLWVQENERVYLLLTNNNGIFTDDLYKWNEISLVQMQKEELPLPIYEEFHGYIVENGQQYHGYTTIRKNIIVGNRYSTDGGATYKNFSFPENTKEVIFLKDDIYFATDKGIWKWSNDTLSQMNNGILNGEWKSFAIRKNAGDNYLVGITTAGLFFHNQKGISTQFIKATDKNEYFHQIYPVANYNYAAVEEGKYGFTGGNYFEAKKMIPISDKEVLLLNHKGFLERWIANKTGSTQDGTFEHLENGVKPIVDMMYHPESKLISILFEDGVFERFDTKKWQVILRQKKFNANFQEGLIEEFSNDGKQLLVSDKKNGLWYSPDEGASWKQINLSFINNLKINHLEFLFQNQTLALATDNGLYFGENITSDNPKWILDKSLGNQPILHLQYRESDEYLVVLTKNKGIFSTNIFRNQNQLITQSIDFINENPNNLYYLAVPNDSYICVDSKIKVHFNTNIPETKKVNYFVEVSDDNSNFPETPFILEGSSIKSPVEVVFRKPQSQKTNGFRLRVIAKGEVNATATSIFVATESESSTTNRILPSIGYSYANACVIDSFKVFTEKNSNYTYQWQKDGKLLGNANAEYIYVKDKSAYKATILYENGCKVNTRELRVNSCEFSNDNKAILLNPPKITTEKMSYYSTEKAILKVDGCENVNYQWLKDDLPIKDATNSTYDVKESGNYKLKIEKFGCENRSKELSIQIINVLANEELDNLLEINVFPNPSADKISIHSKEVFMKTTEILLHDLNGKELKRLNFTNFTNTEIDLNDYQQGSYLLSVVVNNKKIVKKIIIQ